MWLLVEMEQWLFVGLFVCLFKRKVTVSFTLPAVLCYILSELETKTLKKKAGPSLPAALSHSCPSVLSRGERHDRRSKVSVKNEWNDGEMVRGLESEGCVERGRSFSVNRC